MFPAFLSAVVFAKPVALPKMEVCAEAVEGFGALDRVPTRYPELDRLRRAFEAKRPATGMLTWDAGRAIPPRWTPREAGLNLRLDAVGAAWEGLPSTVAVDLVAVSDREPLDQRIVFVVDTSVSMDSPVSRQLPALQQAVVNPKLNHPFPMVSRLELVKAALVEWSHRIPGNATVALVAYEGLQAQVVVEPTSDGEALRAGIEPLETGAGAGKGQPLQLLVDQLYTNTVPCSDERVVIFTHDLTWFTQDPKHSAATLSKLADRGVQIWGAGIGRFGEPVSSLSTLLDDARGGLLSIDNAYEGGLALSKAFASNSALARDASVTVRFDGPWRRAGAPQWSEAGADFYSLDGNVTEATRLSLLYETQGSTVSATLSSSTLDGKPNPPRTDNASVAPYSSGSPEMRERALMGAYLQSRIGSVDWNYASLVDASRELPLAPGWTEIRAWIERTDWKQRSR